MPKIQKVTFPIYGDVEDLKITILNFMTDDEVCTIYYELLNADYKRVVEGNITLTQSEFNAWGEDNGYIDNLVATKLGLTIINN